MMTIKDICIYGGKLETIPDTKLLINTINAYSYTAAQKDSEFREALVHSDILLPDGVSMVFASWFLMGKRLRKIAGAELFIHELKRLNQSGGKCFFLGSRETTLSLIRQRIAREYTNIKVQTYSPPFRDHFSRAENDLMISAVNAFKPDVLMVGMTAPKQEKWAYRNFEALEAGHVCSVGAVFDFYAGTVKRAPHWMIKVGLEWLYRLFMEPRRMWRRYLIGNPKFMWLIYREKLTGL